MNQRSHILPIIILSQFAGTSLWFAGNAIANDLISKLALDTDIIPYMLSSVQFGFITGTLVFAFLTIADRFSPSRVFMICSLLAASCNLYLLLDNLTSSFLLVARFGVGFFLAGIYPVGMKIAADYFEKGLGKALGYLVGALVLGTAFPHFIQWLDIANNYKTVIIVTSTLAAIGGIVLFLFVPNGPNRKAGTKLRLGSFLQIFKIKAFRKAAFGYFGHMWELYAFWAFVPVALRLQNSTQSTELDVSLWSFIIIAIGSVSCIVGGWYSLKFGSRKVAITALAVSGVCCLISPFIFNTSSVLFLVFYFIWGMAVIADSPQFSTLVASTAPPQLKGTALTIVNCIGFAITIISIQLISFFSSKPEVNLGIGLFLPLAIGPIVGCFSILRK